MTIAGPVPVSLLAIETHGTVDVALQEQSNPVEMLTGTVLGCAPTDTLLLDSVAPQLLPACVTVKPRPAIVSVATRVKPLVFGVTE